MEPNLTPQVGDALSSSLDMVLSFGGDFLAFILLAGLVAVFAFYFGRDRLVPLMAGALVAVPLYQNFPFFSAIGGNAWLHLGLYGALVIVGLVAFMGLASWVSSSGTGFVKSLGLSVLVAGILLAVAINILPLSEVYTVSEPTHALFASQYFFWWLAAGVVGTFVLGK